MQKATTINVNDCYQSSREKNHLKFLFSQLWQGKVTTVLEYLKTKVTARNRDKLEELIGYTALKVYRLAPASEYVEVNQSPTFSSLPLLELSQFFQPSEMSDDTTLFRSFRTWVRGFSS